MKVDDFLKDIPNKFMPGGNIQTTSHKFKRDVWDFVMNELSDRENLVCAEFGTHRGETTRMLSALFGTVHTVNINDSVYAKKLNRGMDNILYHVHDLHNRLYPFEEADVIFVDADHNEEWVIHDVLLSKKLLKSKRKKIYVFDDYGINTQPGVKSAVDTLIEHNVLSLIRYIGHEEGTVFFDSDVELDRRFLTDWEGLICVEV